MISGLTDLLPVAIALLLLTVREAWLAHRRSRMNQALHEARRPLQAIALSLPAGPGRLTPVLPVWQAIQALGEVDRQINGGAPERIRPEPIACRIMTEACVRRWQSRAKMSGAGIELRWTGPEAMVKGDPTQLSAALENLIVNAIEHGGPRIVVRALVIGKRLRVEVADNGKEGRPRERVGSPAEVLARLRGQDRHGHGLKVVRDTVAGHGGRFEIEIGEEGTRATVTLPCGSRPAAPTPGMVGVEG